MKKGATIPMAEIIGLHHLSLRVRDITGSTAWYSRVLGLVKAFEHADRDQGWVKVPLVHPTNGLRLSLTNHVGSLSDPFSELHTRLDHGSIHTVAASVSRSRCPTSRPFISDSRRRAIR